MLTSSSSMLSFLLLVAASSLTVVQSKTPDNVSSRLMIHIPHSLFRDDGYDHREALFGHPPYGGSIAQNVYYADSTLCDAKVDNTKGYPQHLDSNGKAEPWRQPYILMVDRGGCTFVQKVRNAQHAGAAGVVIADNTCLCSDNDCVKASGVTTCETSEPIMADDGSGSDITIPSFLMFKVDADKVKVELKANTPVQLEMSWSLPKPDARVEYDLWSVPTDKVSHTFLSSFKPIAKALGDRAYFTPHMYIYDGVRTHCQGNDGENFCYNLCTNNGRYCATDPDNNLDKGISGADVVKESLRRICIWRHYGAENGVGEEWWNYVKEFQDRCSSTDFFANDDCINDAFKHSGVEPEKIKRCMQDSGGLEGSGPNAFLDSEISAQKARGVVVLPTAFVNSAAIRGQLSISTIFSAICAGYADGTRPEICGTCANCIDPVSCVENGRCMGGGSSSSSSSKSATEKGTVSTHTFAFWMLFVIGGFAGAGFYYYRKTREDMREQVRGILAEYMPLDGGENERMASPMDFAQRGGSQSLMS